MDTTRVHLENSPHVPSVNPKLDVSLLCTHQKPAISRRQTPAGHPLVDSMGSLIIDSTAEACSTSYFLVYHIDPTSR